MSTPRYPSASNPQRRVRAPRNAGFNLIEIALAIFVLSLGLLAIFGLFPHGLGMADIARQETQSGMFADYAFGALRAAAADADWTDDGFNFQTDIWFESRYIQVGDEGDHVVRHHDPGDVEDAIRVYFPRHGEGNRHETYVRYTLRLGSDGDDIGTALLTVWPGRTGEQSHKYYTQFYNFREVEP